MAEVIADFEQLAGEPVESGVATADSQLNAFLQSIDTVSPPVSDDDTRAEEPRRVDVAETPDTVLASGADVETSVSETMATQRVGSTRVGQRTGRGRAGYYWIAGAGLLVAIVLGAVFLPKTPQGRRELTPEAAPDAAVPDAGASLVGDGPVADFRLQFDGWQGYARVADIGYDGQGPFTIEATVLNRSAHRQVVLLLSGYLQLEVDPQSGCYLLRAELPEGRQVAMTSDSPVAVEHPTKLAVTWDGRELAMFVDGVRQSQSLSLSAFAGDLKPRFQIGAAIEPEDGNYLYFAGQIDDVRVSRGTLYTDTYVPADRFESDEATLALYSMDGGRGATIVDRSGHDRHGSMRGAVRVPAEAEANHAVASPQQDFALMFDGRDSRVDLKPLRFDRTQPLTLEARVRLLPLSKSRMKPEMIVGCHDLLLLVHYAWITQSYKGKEVLLDLRSTGEPARPRGLRAVHFATVWNGRRVTMYLDGEQIAESDYVVSRDERPYSFHLGGGLIGSGRGVSLNGLVDEVRISNAARYNGPFIPEERFEPDLFTLALYHCDEGAGDVLKDASGRGNDGTIDGAKWVQVDRQLNVVDESASTAE